MNSIVIAIAKLTQAFASADPKMPIHPVRLPPDCRRGVSVNRVSEQQIDEFTCATLVVTCYGIDFEAAEDAGRQVILAMSDEELFKHEDVDDIEFEKMPGDVTGYDEARACFIRQLECVVKW